MKIIIPSYNRAATIQTQKYLEAGGCTDYQVILHSEEQAAEYRREGVKNIVVSGVPRGVTHQRNWITRNLVSPGEWYVSMDDNVRGFRGVRPDHYDAETLPVQSSSFDKSIFDYQLNWPELSARFASSIHHAEERGAAYVGFATVPNYYFLGRKWRYVGYVISKVVLIKKMGIYYDTNLEAMEDFGFCAENLVRFGRVLINNFIIPQAGHYEPGGIGTYSERVERKIKDCAYLMQKYPGLFRYKVKEGCHPKAELQIRFTSSEQVERWRAFGAKRAAAP